MLNPCWLCPWLHLRFNFCNCVNGFASFSSSRQSIHPNFWIFKEQVLILSVSAEMFKFIELYKFICLKKQFSISCFNSHMLFIICLQAHTLNQCMWTCTGEGNGNSLQYSCLENPRDGGAWWAAVYGVIQSQTWLKQLSSSSGLVHMCKCNTKRLLQSPYFSSNQDVWIPAQKSNPEFLPPVPFMQIWAKHRLLLSFTLKIQPP